jgi:hypothetical protein
MAGIRVTMNPMHASMTGYKPPNMGGAPGAKATLGHFATPDILEEGHNNTKMPHTKAHPGFAALVKRGVPAGALANASRNASPAAKKANPRLKRVK